MFFIAKQEELEKVFERRRFLIIAHLWLQDAGSFIGRCRHCEQGQAYHWSKGSLVSNFRSYEQLDSSVKW